MSSSTDYASRSPSEPTAMPPRRRRAVRALSWVHGLLAPMPARPAVAQDFAGYTTGLRMAVGDARTDVGPASRKQLEGLTSIGDYDYDWKLIDAKGGT